MATAEFFRPDAPVRYIAALQHERPPLCQTPQEWNGLFGTALELSPPGIRAMAARGVIAGGEVGDLSPDMRTLSRGFRRYAVIMHSGLMRLIHSAARVLTTSDDGKFHGGEPRVLSPEQIAANVADLFLNFAVHNTASVQPFPSSKFQAGWADLITIRAVQFLLMHELAHIHNGDLSWWDRFFDVGAPSAAQESAADATACRWMIHYFLNPYPGGPQRQILYAGAEFGIRAYAAIETCIKDIPLKRDHPPAAERVAAIREALRSAMGARGFYAIASTSLAVDQMWRAVELLLQKKEPRFEMQRDDVIAGLRTLTVEFLSAGREAVTIQDVPDRPGMKQADFVPTNPTQTAIMDHARTDFRVIAPDVRQFVHDHVGDIFNPNSLQASLFLKLLDSSAPKGDSS